MRPSTFIRAGFRSGKTLTNTIRSETLDAGYLRNLLGQKIAELASERAGVKLRLHLKVFKKN